MELYFVKYGIIREPYKNWNTYASGFQISASWGPDNCTEQLSEHNSLYLEVVLMFVCSKFCPVLQKTAGHNISQYKPILPSYLHQCHCWYFFCPSPLERHQLVSNRGNFFSKICFKSCFSKLLFKRNKIKYCNN